MQNPFDFFAAAQDLYIRFMGPVCAQYQLTHTEFTVLLFLANNRQFDTAAEIVRHRCLTKSHVSVSVRHLLDRGLLKSAYRGQDHRSIHLTLTPAADPVIRDGRAAQKAFVQAIYRDFTPEDVGFLTDYLRRMYANITDAARTFK